MNIKRYNNQGVPICLFLGIFFIASLLLSSFYIPFIQGNSDVKLTFDSKTYLYKSSELASKNDKMLEQLPTLVRKNFFGPVFLAFFTKENPYIIFAFNLILYFVSSTYLIKTLKLRCYVFHGLVFLNAISWISLISLNKEIFIFGSVAMMVTFLKRGKWFWFVLLVLLSSLVRWQLVAFMLLAIFFLSKYMVFRRKRFVHVLLMLSMVTLLIPVYSKGLMSSILFWREYNMSLRDKEGSNLFLVWLSMDQNFLYFLSFPFKILHLTSLNAIIFLSDRTIDLKRFHNFAEVLQSFAFITLYLRLWVRRRIFTLKNDFLYLSILALIFFGAMQGFTPRYLFFPYILLAVFLSQRGGFARAPLRRQKSPVKSPIA
ncbi:hypothetical protein N9Y63_02300 [Akkermansiaceae bacterium]|nr:hypothetical protein [Akkermansiaceae bacterium]